MIGIGGIGGVIGSRLALRLPATGRQVTFIARGPHLAAIRAAGLRLIRPDGTAVLVRPDLATDSLEQAPAPDLAVLCVKSYDLEQVAERLAAVIKPDTVVLPLLNGADIRERLRARLRRGIVPPACIYVSARRREPGTVEHVGGAGKIHLGPDPEAPAWSGARSCARCCERGGNPVPVARGPRPWPSGASTCSSPPWPWSPPPMGRISARCWPTRRLAAQARGVMEEIRRIAAARGVALPADIVESTLAHGRRLSPGNPHLLPARHREPGPRRRRGPVRRHDPAPGSRATAWPRP